MEEKLALLHEILQEENQGETVALARALCPFAEQATDLQILCCVLLVEANGSVALVSEATGLSLYRIRKQVQSRLSEDIIRQLSKTKLRGEGYLKAVCALIDVADSQSQSGASRRAASETIIRMSEEQEARDPNLGGEGRDLSTLTRKELESFVQSIKRELVNLPSPVNQLTIDNPQQLSSIEEGSPK